MVFGVNFGCYRWVRYGAGIMKWTKDELKNLDGKTGKIMSMKAALHTRSNVVRFSYKERKREED